MYYRADGRGRTVVPARSLGEGLYEADVRLGQVTTYYLFVGSRSEELKYTDLPFASLVGVPAPSNAQASAEGRP